MKVFIGADHRGYKLKEKLKRWLAGMGYKIKDCGAIEEIPKDDYVTYAMKVAREMVGSAMRNDSEASEGSRGIVLCGTGVGVDVVVNKVNGVRCGLGLNEEQVKAARHDDDINVLALAADYIGEEEAKKMVKAFLETEFGGKERYVRRLKKIKKLEELDNSRI